MSTSMSDEFMEWAAPDIPPSEPVEGVNIMTQRQAWLDSVEAQEKDQGIKSEAAIDPEYAQKVDDELAEARRQFALQVAAQVGTPIDNILDAADILVEYLRTGRKPSGSIIVPGGVGAPDTPNDHGDGPAAG